MIENLFKGGLITPKLGVKMLKTQIEKQTNDKIINFNMIYQTSKECILFDVTTDKDERKKYEYHDANKLLINIISDYIKTHLKGACILDAFSISTDPDKTIMRAFYVEDGNKKQFEIIL